MIEKIFRVRMCRERNAASGSSDEPGPVVDVMTICCREQDLASRVWRLVRGCLEAGDAVVEFGGRWVRLRRGGSGACFRIWAAP